MGNLAPSAASKATIGIQQGYVEVVGSVFAIHQLNANKKTGEQAPPSPAWLLTLQQLDPDTDKPLADSEPDQKHYNLGRLGKFAPSEDNETAVGEDVGDEGNFFVPMVNGSPDPECKRGGKWPDVRSGAAKLAANLVDKGVNPKLLESIDASVFVGMKGYVATAKEKMDDGRETSIVLWDKITYRPWEEKKSSGSGKKSAGGKKEAAKESAGDGGGSGSAKKAVAAALAKLKAKIADDPMDIAALKKAVKIRLKIQNEDLVAPGMELMDDEDQLVEIAADAGIVIDDGKAMVEE